jgi:hypothetical protein
MYEFKLFMAIFKGKLHVFTLLERRFEVLCTLLNDCKVYVSLSEILLLEKA